MSAPPPYTLYASSSSTRRRTRPTLASLPLHLLHRIFLLTLSPSSTPSRFSAPDDEERTRRIWALFRGLRPVNRTFYRVATSILHDLYLAAYGRLVQVTSDPVSSDGLQGVDGGDVVDGKTREGAVLDRFIAVRVGAELRRMESSLTDESDAEAEIFTRLQPSARAEDLLRTLDRRLVSPSAATRPRQLPLSWGHTFVVLTPGWAQVYVSSTPVARPTRGAKLRDLVVEVRRAKSMEETVRRISIGLIDISKGVIPWGGRLDGV